MLFLENLAVALRSLSANKLRSLLTTLGIVIGTAAVIAVVSIVQGLQYMLVGELQGVGATYVMVLPLQQRTDPGVVAKQVRLTWEDGEAIAERVPGIAAITPLVMGNQQLKFLDRQHSAVVIGTLENWPEVRNHTVDQGRFFSRFDVDHRRKVVVVGNKVVEELRLGEQPVGKEIYVGNLRAVVIGIMEERGQNLGQDSDNIVFVPFDTAIGLFGRRAAEQIQVHMQTESVEAIPAVEEGIKELLRQRHQLVGDAADDFMVLVQDQLLKAVTSFLKAATYVIGAIVGVALLVAGIGIMNIMLVSVTERTREIGVRKSVGARRKDILLQFLIEAITLSFAGGAIGVATGYGMGVAVIEALRLIPVDLPPAHVPVWAIGLAFGTCVLVGVIFGVYPAAKAARLDPIEALRYE